MGFRNTGCGGAARSGAVAFQVRLRLANKKDDLDVVPVFWDDNYFSLLPGEERLMGVVDRFFAEKGFGFVRYGDGQTLFFHVTQCPDGVTLIQPGTAVSFIVGHNPKKGKPQAEAIRLGD